MVLGTVLGDPFPNHNTCFQYRNPTFYYKGTSDPLVIRIHITNPNKDPGSLNQALKSPKTDRQSNVLSGSVRLSASSGLWDKWDTFRESDADKTLSSRYHREDELDYPVEERAQWTLWIHG